MWLPADGGRVSDEDDDESTNQRNHGVILALDSAQRKYEG